MLGRIGMLARCRRVARVLQSYLDGEVDPPTAAAFEEHLEACRRCGLEVTTYTAIKVAIAAVGVRSGPAVDPEALAQLQDFAHALGEDGPPSS